MGKSWRGGGRGLGAWLASRRGLGGSRLVGGGRICR